MIIRKSKTRQAGSRDFWSAVEDLDVTSGLSELAWYYAEGRKEDSDVARDVKEARSWCRKAMQGWKKLDAALSRVTTAEEMAELYRALRYHALD